MSASVFLRSKVFLKQLLIAAIVLIGLLFLVVFLLQIYTDHGNAIEVPDFKGLSKYLAEQLAEEKGLNLDFYDSAYHAGVVPGTVIGQQPQAGYKVKKGRTIYLVYASTTAEMIQMPNLKDISLRQAVTLLESYGFVLGPIEYQTSEYKNLVLDQKINGRLINPGDKVAKGSTIGLVVGRGLGDKNIAVPDLVGLDLSMAKAILTDSLLNVGVVVYDQSVLTEEDKARARIWKQRPAVNETLKAGSSIDFWMTIDNGKIKSHGSTPKEEDNF